ncbi:hypothetical protein GE061_013305 [Apolygus lucorum]|uniref:Uncharacterized protein n=1 Tax=Apolygus lucorum TaxID=248454 RepID=A0A8S9XMB0_APOLU|nr:hypothetical protein GE061_013305 [Apolygus lucorum]
MEELFEQSLDDDFRGDPDEELIITVLGAAEHGDMESLKAVKGAEPLAFSRCLKYYGGRLLFEAVRWRQYEAADFLLCNGCSTEMALSMKTTALHWAAKDNRATVFLYRLLMYQNAKTRDVHNNTPLHVACFADSTPPGCLWWSLRLRYLVASIRCSGECQKFRRTNAYYTIRLSSSVTICSFGK